MATTEPTYYEIFDDSGRVHVDYEKKRVAVDEYGGWSRRYEMTFDKLLKFAAMWHINFDVNLPEAELADLGARLIWANHALEHGLSADRYLNRPTTLTEAEKGVVKAFQALIQTHGSDFVMRNVKVELREEIRTSIEKLDEQ